MVCPCCNPHADRFYVQRNFHTHEKQLIAFIDCGDIGGVRRKLAAGARANGCKKDGYHPIINAARKGRVAIARLLLKEGANPDSATPKDLLNSDGNVLHAAGTRPLHVAAQIKALKVFQVLLRAGASVNTQDANGLTPLLAGLTTSRGETQEDWQNRIILVRELLEAGADLTLRDKDGCLAVHYAAALEDPVLVKMIVWKMPEAINFFDTIGQSPLFVAAWFGRAKTVSQLLAMGASEPARICRDCNSTCDCVNPYSPLRVAAMGGHLDILLVLIDAVESLGGLESTIPAAIDGAITCASIAYTKRENPGKSTKILQLLLAIEGEERRGHWARSTFLQIPVLHHAAVSGTLATVSLLLAAGADETVVSVYGKTASEVVCASGGVRDKSPAEKAATRRMLARGSAFRARSWVWPVADMKGDEDAASVADLVASASSSGALHSALGVRVWRPASRKFFVKLMGR